VTVKRIRDERRICLLLPGGGGALWLAPGPAVHAAVQRIASARGSPASELALMAGGRSVTLAEYDGNRGMQLGNRGMQLGALGVLRLVWRARRWLRGVHGGRGRRWAKAAPAGNTQGPGG
jgi:hypothetical protein